MTLAYMHLIEIYVWRIVHVQVPCDVVCIYVYTRQARSGLWVYKCTSAVAPSASASAWQARLRLWSDVAWETHQQPVLLSLRRITWDKMKSWLLVLALAISSSSGQQFHEPNSGVPVAVPGTPPLARGPSPKRHHHQVGKKKENCPRDVTTTRISTSTWTRRGSTSRRRWRTTTSTPRRWTTTLCWCSISGQFYQKVVMSLWNKS